MDVASYLDIGLGRCSVEESCLSKYGLSWDCRGIVYCSAFSCILVQGCGYLNWAVPDGDFAKLFLDRPRVIRGAQSEDPLLSTNNNVSVEVLLSAGRVAGSMYRCCDSLIFRAVA